MTDHRDRPQYGEYATPEEQRARIRQPDATYALDEGFHPGTVPAAPPPEPAMPQVKAERRSHLDRVATFALLLLGAFNVFLSAPSYLDYSALATRTWDMLSIPGEFTNVDAGRTWGLITAIVLIVGYAATAIVTIRSLRKGRISWWIPLVGAVVTSVIAGICVAVPILGDPAFVQYMAGLSGQ